MGLSGRQGTAFYEFDDIVDEKEFKAIYRQWLNELPLNETAIESIMNEANAVFEMNMNLFQELEGNTVKSFGQALFNTLTGRRTRNSSDLAPAD